MSPACYARIYIKCFFMRELVSTEGALKKQSRRQSVGASPSLRLVLAYYGMTGVFRIGRIYRTKHQRVHSGKV